MSGNGLVAALEYHLDLRCRESVGADGEALLRRHAVGALTARCWRDGWARSLLARRVISALLGTNASDHDIRA